MKNYVNINSKNVMSYKGNCYNMLDTITHNKKEYQIIFDDYLDRRNDTDKKIESINDKISDLLGKINELNYQIANLEVDIYTCSYNYESLSKQRMNSFNAFKNDLIDIDEHKAINIDIDANLKKYKQKYDSLIVKYNILKERKKHLKEVYSNYKKNKKDLLTVRKFIDRNISIAKKNIDICNYNIDSVNETLENIDILYFSSETHVLETEVQPKTKKYKKIKE